MVDVGGESTRPGAVSVSLEEERERVVPVIKELRRLSDVLISVDTRKSSVAEAACEAGADIINDVSAATDDPEMVRVAREQAVGVILMHMQGATSHNASSAYVQSCGERCRSVFGRSCCGYGVCWYFSRASRA